MAEPKRQWVTDPDLIKQLNEPAAEAPKREWVTDPTVLKQLNATEPYSGSILPFSKDAQGKVSFDSNAGIIGTIKRAVTLPRDVYNQKPDLFTEQGVQETMRKDGEIAERAMDLAGIVSPVNPGVRSGDYAIPGARRAEMVPERTAAPSTGALNAAAKQQYDTAMNAGVDLPARPFAEAVRGVQQRLNQDGIIDEVAPQTHAIIGKLTNPPDGAVVPLTHFEAARKALLNGPNQSQVGAERKAARMAIQALDDLLASTDEKSAVAGALAPARDALEAARGNFAAAKRAETLSSIEDRAIRRAGASNSGQNIDNSIRGRVATALDNEPKALRGFDDAEKAALEGVAAGGPVGNTARFLGNLMGGGGGLGMNVAGAAGAALGSIAGPAGAAAGAVGVPALGFALKRAGAAMTDRALGGVNEATRMRSPLYEAMQAAAEKVPAGLERQAAAIRAALVGTPLENNAEAIREILSRISAEPQGGQ
jgi:hypothetical protein